MRNANELSKNNSISTFIFYFSGHGFREGGQNFLSLLDTDDEILKYTGLSMEDVFEIISDIRRKAKTIVFIDSCRIRAGEKGSNNWIDADKDARGLSVLFSTSQGAPSYENDEFQHGTFSYYLASGLNGEADKTPFGSGDGFVSFKDIVNYVQDKMSGSNQIPRATNIEQYGDFAICKSDIVAVDFPDENLSRIISNLVHKKEGEITSVDLEAITELNLWHKEIGDFEGLGYCKNLRFLESTGATRVVISITAISDSRRHCPTNIAPLSTLTSLEILRLPYSGLTDISPLAKLINLKELILADNDIEDIAPIQKLTNLEKLGLGENRLSDISSLPNLIKLSELALSNNKITTITPLSSLKNIRVLYLSSNRIENATPLSELKNLTQLDVSVNYIKDFTPISNLKSLEKLTISRNEISDIKPISDLIKLKELNISSCKIADLTHIKSLSNLEKLDISDNEIEDISLLGYLKKLKELRAQRNKIKSLNALSSLNNLEILQIDENDIALDKTNRKTLNTLKDLGVKISSGLDLDLKFSSSDIFTDMNLETALCNLLNIEPEKLVVGNLGLLKDLDLSNKNIHYLGGLEYCSNLLSLNIAKNELYLHYKYTYNLTEFTHLTSLKILNLSEITQKKSYSRRGDLSNIFEYLPPSLESLNISNNGLYRINKRFPSLPNLLSLDLSFNGLLIDTQQADIFSEINEIENLDLSHNSIRSLVPLQGLDKLKFLNIEHNDLRFQPGKKDYQILHNLIDRGVTIIWKSGNHELDANEVSCVITDDCICCGACLPECPVNAISEGEIYKIDPERCINCQECMNVCPVECIQIFK